ncbi:MAG: anthranilate phosphoribosyltransferase [Ignavibacteriaceae bacterium]|nr:anthranilate phosphoribosyltransferase [Ignavibacteriaceae bacterium]
MKEYLEKVIEKEDLTLSESYYVMTEIMSGKVNNSLLAGFLVALKSKGETAIEIAGFAQAMRDKSIKIICAEKNVIDVCGTGGDESGSFNISTATAFAAAGAGIKVAKHGNRSVSSKCGSADVLIELGININLTPPQSEEALNKIGIAFLFAPIYHPAMKYAAPVRNELGTKTIFNILGPLTNPAGTKRQLIGVYNEKTAKLMSQAADYLNFDKVTFVCSENKFDEISLGGTTSLFEYNKESDVKEYCISNKTFGYPFVDNEQIKGDTSKLNAKIILDVFENKSQNGAFHTIAANTALALYNAGYSNELMECKAAAEDSILSGAALNKLNELRTFSNKF